ncbi:MAG: hypothetical protein HS117_18980 [Verrucomicrobiaceae bacterium]|nr:hypothetical protein [Verrucomicrobiaceae bacterium]
MKQHRNLVSFTGGHAGWQRAVLLLLVHGGFAGVVWAQTLPEAFGLLNGASVSSGGGEAWVVDFGVSRDGVSVRSGGISHNQNSWIQVAVNGPGLLTYWQRVSTEPDFDYLRVFQNGQEVASLRSSGEIPWTKQTLSLGTGAHVVKWEFSKDEADDEAGADAVWLDQLSLVPADQGPPVIVADPLRTGGEAGATVTLSVSALGLAPLQYQWRRGGVPLTGETNAQLALPGFGAGLVGMYDCVVTNTLGNVTSAQAFLGLVTHGGALDDVTRYWFGHGDVFWLPQTQEHVAGGSALRSGVVADSEKSQFSASFSGPGTLRYWRKLSTEEGFDQLRVRLNGNLVHEASGQREWEPATLVLPAGHCTVFWSYEKNERFAFGEDAVWVDQVRMLLGQQGWLEASFTAEQRADVTVSGWAVDPDDNGLANAFEYLLGRDPLSHLAAPSAWLQAVVGPLEGPGGGPDRFGLLLELPLTLPEDVMLVVEYSESLGDWLPLAQKTGNTSWASVNGGVVLESAANQGRIKVRVAHPDPLGGTRAPGFLRLRLQLLAP